MVDRYDFDVESEGGCDMCGAIAEKCNTGDYVLYEDYAKLEAENKRLKEAEKLLMMFICDSYKNATGKPGKKTAIALMKYVNSDYNLQNIVNSSDYSKVLTYSVTLQNTDS